MASSNVIPLRGVTVVLAVVTAILGGVSHFDSSWVKSLCIEYFDETICIKPYEICDIPGAEKCPPIAMERYFVAMVFICCILSTIFLVLDLVGNEKEQTIKMIDAGYHVVGAVLLIIAAALYILSAEQINDLAGGNKAGEINLRRPEKLAAAGLTLVQGLLCGAIAIFIFK